MKILLAAIFSIVSLAATASSKLDSYSVSGWLVKNIAPNGNVVMHEDSLSDRWVSRYVVKSKNDTFVFKTSYYPLLNLKTLAFSIDSKTLYFAVGDGQSILLKRASEDSEVTLADVAGKSYEYLKEILPARNPDFLVLIYNRAQTYPKYTSKIALFSLKQNKILGALDFDNYEEIFVNFINGNYLTVHRQNGDYKIYEMSEHGLTLDEIVGDKTDLGVWEVDVNPVNNLRAIYGSELYSVTLGISKAKVPGKNMTISLIKHRLGASSEFQTVDLPYQYKLGIYYDVVYGIILNDKEALVLVQHQLGYSLLKVHFDSKNIEELTSFNNVSSGDYFFNHNIKAFIVRNNVFILQ